MACLGTCWSRWYAIRTTYDPDEASADRKMERLIVNAPKGLQVDHINERFCEYGEKTLISKKQWEAIARISEKVI